MIKGIQNCARANVNIVIMVGNYNINEVGGPSEHTRNLIDEYLNNKNTYLYVISKSNENKINKYENATMYFIKKVGPYPLNEFIHFLNIKKIISKIDADIIHFQGTSHYTFLDRKFPSVLTVHGLFFLEAPLRFKRWDFLFFGLPRIMLEKIVFARTKNIIAVSPYVGKILRLKTNARIRVIPNGVDISFFYDKISEKLNRLLFVGYIEPRKGIFNLVMAINKIKKVIPNIKLIIVGKIIDGEYFSKIQQFIKQENLLKNVIYRGVIPKKELINEYRKCSIFVLPSKIEPFGIVLLEAMASGKPIIATRVGGIPNIVKDKETGFLVNNNDVEDLSDKILMLLKNKQLRIEMGQKGRIASTRYKWNNISEETLSFYAEIIETIKTSD